MEETKKNKQNKPLLKKQKLHSELNLKKISPLRPKKLSRLLTTLYVEKPKSKKVDSKDKKHKKTDTPGGPKEPVYDNKAQEDIQGNVLPGFNKDYQTFLFFQFSSKTNSKKFVRWLLKYISSMKEVNEFRALYRKRRTKFGKNNPLLSVTFVNVAFSFNGIVKLSGKRSAQEFGDRAFKLGMAARSTYLGDSSTKSSPGHESNWKVGGHSKDADIVITIASDNKIDMKQMIDLVLENAETTKLKFLFEQPGGKLPGKFRGHEHFGFRDGVSQPAIRGKYSNTAGDYITPRYYHPEDERRLFYSKPGHLLVWPGQFLLGEPRQSTEDLIKSENSTLNFPKWAKRGSFLVIRRLKQNVPLFWGFVYTASKQLGVDPVLFASKLVGRWPSGAPISRSPNADNPRLAKDQFANNHFLFDNDTVKSKLVNISGYPGDKFTQAKADFLARVCPHFAHIRKINPRDSVTDLGKPEDNLSRLLLRRGIPYGESLLGKSQLTNKLCLADRGLLFASFISSIEHQFEFVQRRWSNSTSQPNLTGHDPIIGQNGSVRDRERFLELPGKNRKTTKLKYCDEFVIPTGGGYYFAPTVSAIRDVLAK